LESQFPDDARVLEQIASTLADEGATLQAIPYYEKLAKITKDDYRRVVFGVEAAQLKIKADKRDQD
jgi:rubrerythrin